MKITPLGKHKMLLELSRSPGGYKLLTKALASLGYKQTSRMYSHIARVDLSDEELRRFFISLNFGDATSGIPSLPLEAQKDHYRRVYASHWVMPKEVMEGLRGLGMVAW